MFYERVLGLWVFIFDESIEISARFLRKVPCKYFFTKNTFRKDVHADLYGYLDVNFVVSVFDPNNIHVLWQTESLSGNTVLLSILVGFS